MIGYTTIGVSDMDKAGAFYDALLGELGAKRLIVMDRFILWGTGAGKPMFAICLPFNGEAATVGNGNMIALTMENNDQAAQIHAKAIELGGTCEGEPGNRMDNFYGAYFRDLDGNKMCAYHMS